MDRQSRLIDAFQRELDAVLGEREELRSAIDAVVADALLRRFKELTMNLHAHRQSPSRDLLREDMEVGMAERSYQMDQYLHVLRRLQSTRHASVFCPAAQIREAIRRLGA